MLYIDLLDSVKTAHPETYSREWWRADSVTEQESAIKMAHTTMMVRLLYGETIILPNNQANDSVAWLKAAGAFTALDGVDWPPIAIAAFNSSQPHPDSNYLLEITLKNFMDPHFIFSAWVGLDAKQKEQIVKNLRKETPSRFAEMMDGVKTEFGDKLDDQLREQALGLQRLYNYLVRWEKRGLVVKNSIPTNYSIGKHMSRLRGKDESISALRNIAKIIRKNHKVGGLEARSLWYKYLEALPEPVRSDAKAYIDRYYNEKTSLSVNNGKALLSFSDHNPNTPLIEDEIRDQIADRNRKDGVLGKVALQVYPHKIHGISSLDWKTCTELIVEPDFKDSVNNLQSLYREFDNLKPGTREYFKSYREWRKEMWKKLVLHNDLLTKALAPSVALDSTGMRLIAHISPYAIAAIGGAATTGVGYIQDISPIVNIVATGVVTGVSGWLFDTVKKKIAPEMIKSSAAGRIRTSLDEAVAIKPDEELLQ